MNNIAMRSKTAGLEQGEVGATFPRVSAASQPEIRQKIPPLDALGDLRARIRAIERSGAVDPACPDPRFLVREDGGGNPRVAHDAAPPSSLRSRAAKPSAWRLGEAGLDARLGPDGLELAAVHEIKPDTCGGAARAFALALAVRRLAAGDRMARGLVVWCETRAGSREHGALYGLGLEIFGLGLERLLLVEPAHARDVLWAMEEALGSGALALVAGQIDEAGLTPARRLALAAARGGTPCLLLTHPRTAPAASTATRWRIGARPSAPHPLDPAAPGAPRWHVGLERCRAAPPGVTDQSFVLEWSDVAYRFHLAAVVADRTHGDRSRRRTGYPRS